MLDLIKDLPESVTVALLAACLFLIFYMLKALAYLIQEHLKERRKEKDSLTEALLKNTLAITKLEIKLEGLVRLLEIIPKLEKDVSIAHEKIRFLEKE